MNRALLIGGIAIVILLMLSGIAVYDIFTPDTPEKGRVEELKKEVAELKSQNAKYVIEIRELTAQVGRLADAQPGGMETEEIRKGLTARETELDRRENRLVQREEQLLLDRTNLENERRKFYNVRGLKVEEIGQAREIKENQGRMVARLAQAEERANNWLKAIYAISILFFVGIISFVAFLMYMAAKNRRIDTAMRTVESVSLSTHDRNLLMASLGGRIIEQPSNNDSDH